MKDFFAWSDSLDFDVTKQLSHIKPNWELTWLHDEKKYLEEDDSFAAEINLLIREFEIIIPTSNYHKFEDNIGEYTNEFLNWDIVKKGKRWLVDDYACFLEQGAFHDIDEENLKQAARGRIQAAINRGQRQYDDMEETHRVMLGDLLAVILYHMSNV